jgi:hypothetical protein
MAFRDILPNRMQSDIAYGDYMNAEADINRLQGLNQNLAAYRDALQEAQKAKFVAGEQYLSAINASRANAGQAPFTGWPEEAMGGRRVLPAVDRMGYPLTPQEEAMYAQASPRRVVPLTPAEMATSQPAVRPDVVDTSYSGSGADFGAEEPAQAAPSRVVQLTPEELAAFNAQRNVIAQPAPPQQQEAAPMYPEREHELRRQDLRAKVLATNQLMDSLIAKNRDYAETIRSSFKSKLEALVDPEQMKSFSDLPEGKAAFERVKELNTAASKSAKLLSNQLKTFDNFIAAGDTEAARQYAVSSITKTLQSLTGQDAEQMSEFLRRNAALLSVPEILRQTNSNSWTKDSVGILLDRLQKGDAELIAANPERWAQFAKSAVNDYATTYNEAIQSEIINKTSPDFAKRIPGSDFMKTFDMPMNVAAPVAGTQKQTVKPKVQSLLEKYK